MSTLSLRIPNSLHEKIRQLAKQEGISINQFLASAAAEKMSAELMMSDKKIGKGVCQVWERVQAQVPAGSEEESQINNILFQFACEK